MMLEEHIICRLDDETAKYPYFCVWFLIRMQAVVKRKA